MEALSSSFAGNRLFRDETQIYYNQFIDKCKQHDIVVVVVSPYLLIYDFRDDLLTEMFRWKCREAAEFIKRQVKGWMHPARERAARQGRWGRPGRCVYWLHRELTTQQALPIKSSFLMNHTRELSGGCLGSVHGAMRRYNKASARACDSPCCFPPFPADMDVRKANKNKIMAHSNGML